MPEPAHFTCDALTLEAASAYRTADGLVLDIVTREPCPLCGGTIRVQTAPDAEGHHHWATFVRLHMKCFDQTSPV